MKPQGIEIAGRPVRLKGEVLRVMSRAAEASRSPAAWPVSRAIAASGVVGVRMTSSVFSRSAHELRISSRRRRAIARSLPVTDSPWSIRSRT